MGYKFADLMAIDINSLQVNMQQLLLQFEILISLINTIIGDSLESASNLSFNLQWSKSYD